MSRDLNLQCNVKVGNKAGNINVKKNKTCQFKTWCNGDKSNIETAQITFARTLDRTH